MARTARDPPARALSSATLRRGAAALAARDPDLARVLASHGPPPLWGRRPGFATLIRIILEQQVSLAAAATLYRRITNELGGMHPATVRPVGVDGLRRLGLTRQKAAYCHGLSVRLLEGSLDLGHIARSPDAAGRAMLLAVPGLGPWSVDIYYLMALRRPDVWPTGDLALAVAMGQLKRLRGRPDRATQERIAAGWAPWRSVAARLLWLHYLCTRGPMEPSRA